MAKLYVPYPPQLTQAEALTRFAADFGREGNVIMPPVPGGCWLIGRVSPDEYRQWTKMQNPQPELIEATQ
jgi:hypothetical protein